MLEPFVDFSDLFAVGSLMLLIWNKIVPTLAFGGSCFRFLEHFLLYSITFRLDEGLGRPMCDKKLSKKGSAMFSEKGTFCKPKKPNH